jgi:hypothetical protein
MSLKLIASSLLVARRKQNVTDVGGKIVVPPANGLGLS